MAITYTWEFDQNSVKTETIGAHTNVITEIDWRLKASDTRDGVALEATTSDTVKLDTSDLTTFVEFQNLTQTQVEAMIKGAMLTGELAYWRQILSDGLDGLDVDSGMTRGYFWRKYTPSTSTTLPFVTQP